jgi:ribosomal protein S18 acetylase RimI-like enzyme
MLELTTHATAATWLAAAQADLEREEAANGLILGVGLRLHAQPERITTPPYLATVHDGAQLAAAAAMTPPYRLLVYAGGAEPGAAFELLARDMLARGFSPRGVNGRVPDSGHFANVWQRVRGQQCRPNKAMRAFKLRAVIPPRPAPGTMRVAAEDDLPLVQAWLEAFDRESFPNEVGNRPVEMTRAYIRDGFTYLWVDGKPVCVVGLTRPLPHGMTIAPVYTPPEFRNRGYASACTAAVSQTLLDRGCDYVTLFTDLSNPTSNGIYQKIGYRPVCDYADFDFHA